MNMNQCVWFEIYVEDMLRAKKFYEAVFQTTLVQIPSSELEMWSFPLVSAQSYGAHGALVKMEGIKSGGNSTVVYFHCEDCAIEAKRAERNDGKLLKEKFSIGENGFIALVFDTEGNAIGLHSR
ncbi:MAG: VOC family protein [Campylobacterales bacterium]|nr:VOC family protein [Campylobacterales bacterium]